MGRQNLKSKKAQREAAKWEASVKPPARPMICTRCGENLPSASAIPAHNTAQHLAGGGR